MRALKVYKGNLVPARNSEGGVLLVTEAPDPQEFEGYLGDLRRYLEEAVKLSGIDPNRGEERLELIADLIALFYKAPLLDEPIRGLHLSPFKAYLAYRILRSSFSPLRSKSMKDVIGKLGDEVKRELKGVFSILDKAVGRSEKMLTAYPADSRPGYNISSLLVHWLTVSALAWSKGYYQLGRRELARLRIASLLHDIGKPLEPKRHVSSSKAEIRKLLEGLVSLNDLDAIVEIAGSHHSREYSGPYKREVDIIKAADHFSSGMDRLTALVRKVVLRRISELRGISEDDAFRTFYASGGPKAWDAWEELEREYPGIVKRLTEESVRSLILRKVELDEGRSGREEEATFERTSMLKLDVASIQDFIMESEKLPLLAASSYIVDLAVMFNSLRAVQERLSLPEYGVWYPVEGFLYSAGGNILAVVPDGLIEGVKGALKASFSKRGSCSLGFGPLEVRIATTPLSSDYRGMMEDLDRKLLEAKISLVSEPFVSEDPYEKTGEEGLTGLEMVCDYCKRRPATRRIDLEGESYLICEECWEKYRLYSEIGHMRTRWDNARTASNATPSEAFGFGWDSAKNILLELIAGHDSPEELMKERLLNIALLKIDGNLMGAFMARSISLSDALERSARIDLALKKAFRKVLKALRSGVSSVDEEKADREEARLLLGIQYMGGDDSLIISPSWAALPLSTVLTVEFAREMGYSFWEEECAHTGATLSIGLVAAPPRHNVWALLDAAENLLSSAKSIGRFPLQAGALAFDVTEGGLLTGKAVHARKDVLHELGLTFQPWVIGTSKEVSCDVLWTLRKGAESIGGMDALGKKPDVLSFLASLLGLKLEREVLEMSDEELMGIYTGLFEGAYRSYLSVKEGKESRVKEMRDVARRLTAFPGRFGVSPGEKGYQTLVLLYAASKAREKEEGSELYEIITETFKGGTPLEDVSRLCKILLGGAV